MKKLVILFFLILPAGDAFNQIPDISLYNLENNYVTLSELQGENLTVIDFWATWCKPCLIAIPELSDIYEDFKASGVNFIGVNIDSPRNQSKVRPFSNSRGINYPVLLDPDQEAMQEMNVVVVPTLIIFNEQGEMVYSHEGFKPGDQEIIRSEIKKHLKNK